MDILVVSDIHLEFFDNDEARDALIDSLPDADAIVLAGDITTLRYLPQAREDLCKFTEKYGDVIYVPGNHEYYGSPNAAETHKHLGMLAWDIQGLQALWPGRKVEVMGQKFVGGTMWFPQSDRIPMLRKLIHDFRFIGKFEPWVYEQNALFRKEVAPLVDKDTIVVTHHLPCQNSVPNQYRMDPGNIFYVSEQTKMILEKEPKIWIHGHTHTPCDYTVYNTRVVCNPKGYIHEKLPFNPLIIKV